MVLGYMCKTHEYVSECDVTEDGQRICKQCGNAVTGLVGRTRGRQAPPSNEPMMQSGNILWTLQGHNVHFRVDAFDYRDAIGKGLNQVKNAQNINEIYPTNREYRR